MRRNQAQAPSNTTQAQRSLVAEVASHREALLQACWAHQCWSGRALRTCDGEALEVLAPGWLNRGPGPDFTEARLSIGGREYWGDVEVHLKEQEWGEHGHDRDPRYERVILHVVLRRGQRPATRFVSGEAIPALEAARYLSAQVLDIVQDAEDMLRRYERLPGRCGLRAALSAPEAVSRVIAHAAEVRARDKAERILPLLGSDGEEQVLFRIVFSYLGYRPCAKLFAALADRFPLESLLPLLALPYPEARAEVLARWFGALGLLQAESLPGADADCQADYGEQRARWVALRLPPTADGLPRGGSRPWNSPERRIVGLFHHLYTMGAGGWLKGWLAFLRKLDGLRDRPEFRKEALGHLERAFATPGWEPWRGMYSFARGRLGRPARLIGTERVTMLMANAVLPFFLARARLGADAEMEKVLYRLYLILPAEAPNQRTRFMERRLAGLAPQKRTLRTQQGLLQIHQDFCTSFYEGCERCGFPDLIAPAGASPP